MNEAELGLMVEAMRHESFHLAGKHSHAEAGLYVGWVSSAGTFSAAMPVWNEKKNCLLVFFGRHFFDKEDVTALKSRNHVIRQQDASLLIHLYEEKGPAFLNDLNGTYCGLIFDFVREKGFLFNDRFGLHRVHYHETSDAFYFASEAKALIRVLPELAVISERSLAELACCDCVLDNRTLFDKIALLPPGSQWDFEHGEVTGRSSYCDLADWEDQTLLGEDYFCGRVQEVLGRVVPRYFRSENPSAVALSGGMGSRLVLSAAELPQGKLPCFTFTSQHRESADAKWAKALAERAGQSHRALQLGGEFLREFPRYAEKTVYLTDGSALVSNAAELYLTGRAREIAAVAVTGKFLAQTLKGERQLNAELPAGGVLDIPCHDVPQRLAANHRQGLSGALSDLPLLHSGRVAVERQNLETCTPFLDRDIVKLLYRAPEGAIRGNRLALKLLARANGSSAVSLDELGYSSRTRRRTAKGAWFDFIRQADRVFSGATAPRSNLFTMIHRFPRFRTRILGRDTYSHFRVWYGNELASFTKEVLLDPRTLARPYVCSRRVEAMLQEHARGLADYTREITLLLTLELLHRLLVDNARRTFSEANALLTGV